MNRKNLIGVLAAVLTAATIAGCGTGASTATSPAGSGTTAQSSTTAEHNDADIAFVQGMIPHHTQAVTMSGLVAGRASSPQVIDLATEISKAQGPEITQMQGFLTSWGQPPAPTDGMGGMDGSAMPGMMTDQQMQQLGTTTGTTFDRMWLQMMTEHHTGAVEMAQTELRDGQSADAKALAQKIIDAQQAEITTMQGLLTTI